jgi:predicted nucleic acid-binding Zn ribbon protein
MGICRGCVHNSINSPHKASPLRPDEHCIVCGCTLSAKTKCLSCSCPKDLWKEEMTQQEEKEIEDET